MLIWDCLIYDTMNITMIIVIIIIFIFILFLLKHI